MSSMPRQRGVTEFQPKRVLLSLTLMDQGQTNNHNVIPSSYPMKFWGLLAMVAPLAHVTQQKFLIGSYSKFEIFHWSQC